MSKQNIALITGITGQDGSYLAELLLENRYTVAEVSYKVGINDPFYFSKCFKQQFGVAPSVYLRGKEESGIQETENKE